MITTILVSPYYFILNRGVPYSTTSSFLTQISTISPSNSDSISFINFIASTIHTTCPFEILSPGGRAVQTTQNLEEFWKTSWIGVKKELKARYPKHFKPGDPY